MKKILFVCTGNSCRSVIAEGLFRKMTEDREEFLVSSAGTSAADGFPPMASTVRVMDNEGIDVSKHRSRRLTAQMVQEADRIFVMEQSHKDWVLKLSPDAEGKVALLGEYSSRSKNEEIDIPDPIHMSDQFYKNILLAVRDCLKNVLAES